MKKFFKYLFFFFMLLVVMCVFLITTQTGLRVLIYSSQKFSPVKFKIQNIQGNFISGFDLSKIVINDTSYQVYIEHLQLRWHPLAFLTQQKLIVSNLVGQKIKVWVLPQQNKNTVNDTSSTYSLSFLTKLKFIRLYHLAINDFLLYNNEQRFQIFAINFTPNSEGSNQYQLQVLLPAGKIQGQMTLEDVRNKLNAHLELDAQQIDLAQTPLLIKSDINFKLLMRGFISENDQYLEIRIPKLFGHYQSYALRGEVNVELAKQVLTVHQLQLALGSMRLNAHGNIDANNSNFLFNLTIPSLAVLSPNLHGMIQAEGELKQAKSDSHLHATLKAKNLNLYQVKIPQLDGNIRSNLTDKVFADLSLPHLVAPQVKIKDLRLHAFSSLFKSKAETEIEVVFNQTNHIHVKLNHADYFQQDILKSPLDGQVKINFTNFTPLNSQQIKNMHGSLSGEVNVSGLINRLSATGNLLLKTLPFKITELGINPSIELNMKVDYPGHSLLQGNIKSGAGHLKLNASINPQQLLPLVIHAQGSTFTALNLANYNLNLSPNLQITLQKNRYEIEGKIVIDHLKVNADNYHNLVTLPAETIIENGKQPKTLPPELAMRIRLQLGNTIYIAYKGLKANLAGEINIFKRIGALPTASGIIQVKKGEYRIYNTYLNIEQGRLIYAGNLISNPLLNITVKKNIKTPPITENQMPTYGQAFVGAHLTGTLDEPNFNFISNPSMDQTEILSYLVLNSSASSLDGSNASLLSGVASQLNFFDSNAASGSLFSPLIGMVGTSIFSNGPTLNLRHEIVHNWWIQTQASMDDTNVDLVYAYETD